MKLNSKVLDLVLEGFELRAGSRKLIPSTRKLKEIKSVLYDKNFLNSKNSEEELYYMYRAVGNEEEDAFRRYRIKYDITIVKGIDLGSEHNKTLGHYHAIAEKGLSYPEIYEVIDGRAIYLLQKPLGNGEYEVRIVNAYKGEKLYIPPNYGHITINPEPKSLVMSNLVGSEFKSDYESIIKMGGGAIFSLCNGEIVFNKSYRDIHVSIEEGADMPFSLEKGRSLYDEFVEDPAKFEFLDKPSILHKNGKG